MKLSDAQKIKAARALLYWTQKDLASKSGVSHSTICMLENGKHKTTNANRAAIFRCLLAAGCGFTDNGVWLGDVGVVLGQLVAEHTQDIQSAVAQGTPTDPGSPVPERVGTSRADGGEDNGATESVGPIYNTGPLDAGVAPPPAVPPTPEIAD